MGTSAIHRAYRKQYHLHTDSEPDIFTPVESIIVCFS